MYRETLLQPQWLQNQGPRYWDLSELDQAVWNQTRGLALKDDVVGQWASDLEQAMHDGIISDREAMRALNRWTQLISSMPNTKTDNSMSKEPQHPGMST